MEKNIINFNENGYCIFKSIPNLRLLQLRKYLYILINNSYSKNIRKLEKPVNDDYLINSMFIDLEKKIIIILLKFLMQLD